MHGVDPAHYKSFLSLYLNAMTFQEKTVGINKVRLNKDFLVYVFENHLQGTDLTVEQLIEEGLLHGHPMEVDENQTVPWIFE